MYFNNVYDFLIDSYQADLQDISLPLSVETCQFLQDHVFPSKEEIFCMSFVDNPGDAPKEFVDAILNEYRFIMKVLTADNVFEIKTQYLFLTFVVFGWLSKINKAKDNHDVILSSPDSARFKADLSDAKKHRMACELNVLACAADIIVARCCQREFDQEYLGFGWLQNLYIRTRYKQKAAA